MTTETPNIDIKREKAAPAPAVADPWAPLSSLRSEIDRLFDDFGAGFLRHPLARRGQALLPSAGWPVSPAMELAECDGEYRITAELPGMTPEQVEVRLTDGTISIRGEKSEERKDEKAGYMLSERRYGSFQRSIALPPGVDADAIAARFADGVLTVTVPKTAEAKQKARKVEVSAA